MMASHTMNFMETPLVTWVQTFCSHAVSYKDLFDGVYLNTVMHEIDSKCITEGINTCLEDVRDRMHNWDILMKNIKSYYREILQQMIVMKLPNIITISKEPESDEARGELTRVLLLILGCAIQCEQKEDFIDNIKSLDEEVQHAIVVYIKEITDDTKNVYAIELPPEDITDVSRNILSHLHVIIQERDGYVEDIKELNQTLEDLYQAQQTAQQELQAHKAAGLSPGTPGSHTSSQGGANTPEKHHLAVELAETKAKLRKVRQELEDKTEISNELQEELDELKVASGKLRAENLDLLQDARAARTYRDELDILKEKASRVDKYELEVGRYKEKLNELEFYKARTEELREDNQVLLETKNVLEDQLSSTHKRTEAFLHLEEDLAKYKEQVEAITMERDIDREKLQEVIERNARLEFEKKSSFNENANLEEELVKARRQLNVGLSTSLSEQFSNSSNARVLRLELENQRLQQQVDELQGTAALESNTKLLELQKENLRLSTKVENLQLSSSKEVHSVLELEQKMLSLSRDKEQLEQAMETVKESSERQVNELHLENEQLQLTVQTLRERNEKTLDMRVKDTERENKRLHESVKSYSAKASQLEFEKRQLKKTCERLEDNVEKVHELEELMLMSEHEKDDLGKQVATLQLTCDKFERLEQDNSDMEVENEKLMKTVDNLKGTIAKLKTLEQDNINLTVETQHLRRTIETMKNSSSRLVNMEQDKHELQDQIDHLHRELEMYKTEQTKQEQLESDLYEMDTQNQKLQRHLEGVMRKLETLQKDNGELESNNTKLQKALDNAKLSSRKADKLEKELKEMEQENVHLGKDKANIDKENRRLKQALEAKAAMVDDLGNKISGLERENRSLRKSADRKDDMSDRMQDVERENMELVRQSGMDKRALATLREELVNEKLKTQQLNNELDKMNQELKKVGLNKEKLFVAMQTEDESKYKALESMMNETYRRTLEIREEKIQALESRLDESKDRNLHLQEDVKTVKRQYEALQQRREEESLQTNSFTDSGRIPPQIVHMPNATKDILELKDHIISVERTNATMEAEMKNLKFQSRSLQERLEKSEQDNSKVRSQMNSTQKEKSALQSQLAKSQVDNTTMRSQNESLLSQNSNLQKDCSRLEAERNDLLSDREDILSKRQDLMADHDTLQQLHNHLTKDYDGLISEHGSMKANFKTMKAAYEELVDEHAALSREKMAVSQLKQIIAEDQRNMKTDSARLSHLKIEYIKLKEEVVNQQNDNGKVTRKFNELTTDHKAVKQENNNLKMKYSELQDQYTQAKDRLAGMDMELNKLYNKCETMNQLNIKLEEENRSLMMQVKSLITQNHDVLVVSLERKDQQAEEQKHYLEKLAELRRQKEKLEEKIMEQYKRYDPVKKKNKGFNFMRRAKQMVSRSKSKDRTKAGTLGSGDFSITHDSGENSSLGSGSIGENQDMPDRGRAKGRKGRYNRHHGNSSLQSQNKALAKSTTALSSLMDDPPTVGMGLRAARSTENLLDSHRRGDGESMSSSSDLHNPEWSTRPSRRRTVADRNLATPNTSDVFARNGSHSSEDTPGSRGHDSISRITDVSMTPRSSRSMKDMASQRGDDDDDDDDDDDENGLISLLDFLSEVDKSPKSRRKYIQQAIVEAAADKKTLKDDAETSILSPQLGPRSPLIDNEETSPSKLKSRNWKSEMNISQLSKTPSSGSAFRTFDRRHQLQHQLSVGTTLPSTPARALPPGRSQDLTSTPYGQNGPSQDRRSLERDHDQVYSSERDRDSNRSYSSERERDRNMSHSGASLQEERSSGLVTRLFDAGSKSSVNNHDPRRNSAIDPRYYNGQSGTGNSGQNMPDAKYNNSGYANTSPTRGQPQPNNTRPQAMRPVSSLGIPLHNNTSPQHSSGPDYHGHQEPERSKTPSMLRQSSGSSVGSANIGAYNAMTRQMSAGSVPQRHDNSSLDRSGNRSLPRQANVNMNTSHQSVSYNNNKHNSMDHNYIPASGQRSLPQTPSSADGGHGGYPPPMRAQNSHVINSHSDTDMASQYNPGNVRNLVQDYHQRQQHHPSTNSPPSNPEPPVAPPRRTRPMSAGPVHSSSSAFSLPQRSNTPGIDRPPIHSPEVIRPQPMFPGNEGRSLPPTPQGGRTGPQGSAGTTPTRPQSGPAGGSATKRNHVYYDYGCV